MPYCGADFKLFEFITSYHIKVTEWLELCLTLLDMWNAYLGFHAMFPSEGSKLSAINTTLKDISDVFGKKDESAKAKTVDQLTDLFLASASGFSESHVLLFDQVISVLTDAIEERARAQLAEC